MSVFLGKKGSVLSTQKVSVFFFFRKGVFFGQKSAKGGGGIFIPREH